MNRNKIILLNKTTGKIYEFYVAAVAKLYCDLYGSVIVSYDDKR